MDHRLEELIDSIPHPVVWDDRGQAWHSFTDDQVEQLIWNVIDQCAARMEFRDDPRIVPRPTWQLYELFGKDWRPSWTVSGTGHWEKKK